MSVVASQITGNTIVCSIHCTRLQQRKYQRSALLDFVTSDSGLILGLCLANERRRYKVTPSVTGWAQTRISPVTQLPACLRWHLTAWQPPVLGIPSPPRPEVLWSGARSPGQCRTCSKNSGLFSRIRAACEMKQIVSLFQTFWYHHIMEIYVNMRSNRCVCCGDLHK